jgi:phage terminase large subunit-like protein
LILFSAFFSLGSFPVGEHNPDKYRVPSKLSPEQIVELYKKGKITKGHKNKLLRARVEKINKIVSATEEKIAKITETAKKEDPFWFFEPNTGRLNKEQKEFLAEYLNPEDIPDRVDGQDQALLCTSPEVGVSGGNGSAKTTTTIIRTLIQSTGSLPIALKDIFPKELLPQKFPQRWRFVGVSDAQLEDTVYPRFKEWTPKKHLKNGKWSDSFSSKNATLHLYDGKEEIATIQFKTNRQDVETFQGPDLDGVVYDEEPRSDIYDENLQRFRAATRINILFGFTPTNGLTWLADHFEECGPEANADRSFFMLCTATNKAANFDNLRIIYNKVKAKNPYPVLKMRLLGEFVSLSGLVYGHVFNRSIHVIPPFFEFLPKEKRFENYLVVSGWDSHTVTATAGVFVLVDREGICYVDRCYFKKTDTEQIKTDFHQIKNECGYRMGWSVFDKSNDSTHPIFGDRNIFLELTRGKNAIPAAKKSEKKTGSRKDGVGVIMNRLRAAAILTGEAEGEMEEKPLFIVDRPENKVIINSFRTLENDSYANPDVKGEKDDIREGKHHHHAALRYVCQKKVSWIPPVVNVPEYEPVNEVVNY